MGIEERLTEEDVRNIYITPALVKKWNLEKQIRSEVYFTAGRVIVRGNMSTRAKGEKADYILYYNNSKPIAVVEAKKNTLPVGAGIGQAMKYAEILDIPFAYSTNGKAFLEHDFITGKERELPMEEFPSPEDLWYRYKVGKNITENEEKIINEPYYYAQGINKPRYYQRIAINRTCEAIARNQKRILLVMATGTRKNIYCIPNYSQVKKIRIKKKNIIFSR